MNGEEGVGASGAERKRNNRSTTFSSSASNMNAGKAAISQYNADAKLLSEFEQTGKSFNYATSVVSGSKIAGEDEINVYLSKIQRGGLIQPFGCMFTIEEPFFKIIAYSENCYELLELNNLVEYKQSESLLGVDVRSLLTASSKVSLIRAALSTEISMLNPLWIHFISTQRPFYAILHRIDVGMVIDLEPAQSGDTSLVLAGAVQSQKLAVRAISRLQSLLGGDIGVLCDTLVEDIHKLTGYDRVMVYKFHEDYHGEVVSEIRRSDLEPYLGLHYPATDIPQAARFLFKQNRVRMICDCSADPVKIIQSEELMRPLCLVNSTLRAPYGCHTQYMMNMESIASLVMAIIVSGDESTRLWGLAVCHHTSPRYVPFPLRYACEFLMQAFAVQLHMELQLGSQIAEKKILRMQTMLCDMLLRDAPFGIVTQSPNIMDLVKCDGAAMIYRGKCWLIGVTPTESEVNDIVQWLLSTHTDLTGLSTDSLVEAGYPGAIRLGDAVCGMATARITSTDFLFWFRSHAAKEVKWGGAKHHSEDRDNGAKMHPRSSFKVFLEVVKSRSFPWEVAEISAIHSLQLIMRDACRDIEKNDPEMLMYRSQGDSWGKSLTELSSVAHEMVRLIETATAPIFGVDSSGFVNGWNAKIAEMTGLQASQALGKSLVNEIIHKDSRGAFESLLCRALQGEEEQDIEVKLQKFRKHSSNAIIHLVVNACTSRDYTNQIVGVCFVGQDVTFEKVVLDQFIRLQGDYKAIIQSPYPVIPPIFASDENACCSEWNAAMEKLTGFMRHEVIGKILPGEVFGGLCQLKGQDDLTKFMILLYQAINGYDTESLSFGFFDKKGKFVDVYLTANKRVNEYGAMVGCFCFLRTIPTDQPPSSPLQQEESECTVKLKELVYICQQMKNPLNGIRFTHKLLEGMNISDNQKHLLKTSDACERQIMSIIGDINYDSVMEGSMMKLNNEEFTLGNVIDAIVSQVMALLKEKNLQLIHGIPNQMKALPLIGDQIKLQQILSDLLISIAQHTPSDSWVEIKVFPGLKSKLDRYEYIHLQFSLVHPGEGLSSALIDQMFGHRNECTCQQGIALNICYSFVSMMNGRVNYIREKNKCYFQIDLELRTQNSRLRGSNV